MRTRKVFFASILVPILAASAAGPAPAALKPHTKTKTAHQFHVTKVIRVAPADEYFGRLKLSILGIRNQLHDLAIRVQYAPEKSADVLGPAGFVEDALHDWEHKYPQDPWLPKNVYQLSQLYAQIHTDEGDRDAARTRKWLLGRYSHSPYAAQARAETTAQVK